MILLSILTTSFMNDQFYRSEKGTIEDLENAFNSLKDKKFAAKSAIFARNEFGIRSITHLMSALIAKNVKCEQWTKDFFDKVTRRVDDITEILSCYIGKYGKPIPNSLRKGLKKAFDKFDRYQLAKYKAEKKDISLIDAVNLVRPIPNDKNKEALKSLIDGNLKQQNTWESELSKAGQGENKEELKSDVWKKLILEKKIGYFALLRNLRNIIEQSPDILDKALELLVDENMIRKSLVLPFRFTTAYDQILKMNNSLSRKALVFINHAINISCQNVPEFEGETLIVCDYSASMGKGFDSYKGKGTLLGAILAKKNNSDFMIFGDYASYVNYNPSDNTISIFNHFHRQNQGDNTYVGHGTNFHSIFEIANKKYDRIIIFSDMQGWVGHYSPVRSFNLYKQKYNCNPFIYSVDLAGYGSLQFPENQVFFMAGFSEKIFDIMKLLEQDKNALIKKINRIEI
jgi:hypothetical protein